MKHPSAFSSTSSTAQRPSSGAIPGTPSPVPITAGGWFEARIASHATEILQLYMRHGDVANVWVADLPAPIFATAASVRLGVERDRLPGGALEALRLARVYMRRLGVRGDTGIEVEIRTNVPIRKGAGSSTALHTAVADATARACGIVLTDEELQALVFEQEGASDPLALIRSGCTVVYGSRNGRVLHSPGRPLPPMRVVLVDSDPDGMLDTKDCPGAEGITEHDLTEAGNALSMFLDGVSSQDLAKVGAAGTLSAQLHQERIPTREFERMLGLAGEFGAAGLSLAHSGTLCAFLFPRDYPDRYARFGELQLAVNERGVQFMGDYELTGV